MPRYSDPKQLWEKRKANQPSRAAAHEAREKNLQEFVAETAAEPMPECPVIAANPAPAPAPMPAPPVVKKRPPSGDIDISIMVRGEPRVLKLHFRQFEGTVPQSQWGEAALTDLFIRALSPTFPVQKR